MKKIFFIILINLIFSQISFSSDKECKTEFESSGKVCWGYDEVIRQSFTGGISIGFRFDPGIINGYVRNNSEQYKTIYIEFFTYDSMKNRNGMLNDYISDLSPGEKYNFHISVPKQASRIRFIKLGPVKTN